MRGISRTVPGALVALVALLAFTSASASAALPEFAGVGGTPVTFSGSGGSVVIIEKGGGLYECPSSSITGEITGTKQVANVVITLGTVGCGAFCKNAENKLVTRPLKGSIGYVTKATKQVGLLLEPATSPVAECEHSGIPGAKILGSIIGTLGPVNLARSSFTLTYGQSMGTQFIRHFEGEEVLHNLQLLPLGFPTAREIGIANTIALTTARAIEIKA